MPSLREQTEDWTLEQLVDSMANENAYAHHAKAELLRDKRSLRTKKLDAERRAAAAQELAGRAAIETATYTKAAARYMKWSVYVLAASSLYLGDLRRVGSFSPLESELLRPFPLELYGDARNKLGMRETEWPRQKPSPSTPTTRAPTLIWRS